MNRSRTKPSRGFDGFEFLNPAAGGEPGWAIKLTWGQWGKCIADWPERYYTGGTTEMLIPTLASRLLFQNPLVVYVQTVVDPTVIDEMRGQMLQRQGILIDGRWRRVFLPGESIPV